VDYFREVLGCSDRALELKVPSPFPSGNLCVLVMNRASTLYRRREETRELVVRCLAAFVGRRKGNYLLFFPSYQYLSMVLDPFLNDSQGFDVVVQEPGMNEADRTDFLNRFTANPGRTLAGFAVMGGIFGEAIDLVGDRLTGAAIVGVGLPGLSQERDLVRDYYGDKLGRGFEFAYSYPGINRVLQAAGRVIRSETDRGAVLLIDERFSRYHYRRLLPSAWSPTPVAGVEELEARLAAFWQNSREE
jgi:DNA excision repair protein ERCC-2